MRRGRGRGCEMGWEPRRAGRRDQTRDTRDTPGDAGSGRRVPPRGTQRDSQRGVLRPGEEDRLSRSAEEWLDTFRGSPGERPAATGSPPSPSLARHPETGLPSSAGPAVPRYGHGEASGPERGARGASNPAERFAGQRRYAEPPDARWSARPEAGPTGPRAPRVPMGPHTSGVTGAGSAAGASQADQPGRAGSTAPGRHRAPQAAPRQTTREPGGGGRALPQARGPGPSPWPAPTSAPAPDERGLRRPGPGQPRMPPVNRPSATARRPPPDQFGRAERHVPYPAPSTPVTPAPPPDDETVPLPVILSHRRAAPAAHSDRDAAPVRPARRPANGARPGSGHLRSRPAPMQAKLDQLNDLYVMAEAIGEEALTRYFDQLSQRQRELIREYFEQAGLGSRTGR